MSLGILATIFASLFSGTSSAIQKKVATVFSENAVALFFQYLMVVAIFLSSAAIWALRQGTAYIPQLSGWERGFVIVIWIIGYIWIALLFEAFKHMSTGIAMIIANSCTFIMYFMNLWLYPWQEAFSTIKLILSILFFVVLGVFLVDQDKSSQGTKKKQKINMNILYPIGTAICRSIYWTANSYFIKTEMMSPVQTGMITETLVFVVAVILLGIYSFSKKQKTGTGIKITTPKKSYITLFVLIWLFNTINTYLTYYGYEVISANMVNVIKLFTVPVAALGAWILRKDNLTKKQAILLLLSFLLMIAFIVV